ncbi:histone-like nucleoid-structuring protein Lsr2 [Streptomyces mirabilis]|uniref:Lsr2 family DNA-binding protein n=1 Tax=Streptomyces mirabilis TaxID=68239 RepID=UPI00343B9C06
MEALLAWAENHSAAAIRNSRPCPQRPHPTDRTPRHRCGPERSRGSGRQGQGRTGGRAGGAAPGEGRRPRHYGGPRHHPLGTCAGPGGKRSSEELAAIRTWARANGHQVADRGTPAKAVLDAYDAARGRAPKDGRRPWVHDFRRGLGVELTGGGAITVSRRPRVRLGSPNRRCP